MILPQYNDIHSIIRGEQLQEVDPSLGRVLAHANRSSSSSSSVNRSKRAGITLNGAEDVERRCQYCERFKATHMCAGCKNQWYCSKECQVSDNRGGVVTSI